MSWDQPEIYLYNIYIYYYIMDLSPAPATSYICKGLKNCHVRTTRAVSGWDGGSRNGRSSFFHHLSPRAFESPLPFRRVFSAGQSLLRLWDGHFHCLLNMLVAHASLGHDLGDVHHHLLETSTTSSVD